MRHSCAGRIIGDAISATRNRRRAAFIAISYSANRRRHDMLGMGDSSRAVASWGDLFSTFPGCFRRRRLVEAAIERARSAGVVSRLR